ncbi:MAG TPA: dTDP-4-dehydrorhamnose 3,5-epimerase family protein [Acidimicrobiales bacterium]|nr:dTDP-4-dehydrorhamnose 3,5-epimerase family protein [Acidimicrobiales bacterium]
MNIIELSIEGAWQLESPVWGDDRGFFREWFKLPDFVTHGVDFHARQANLSQSVRNVVRGLHYSLAPEGQAKVVTCVHGALDDVIVDVREGSPTFARVEVVHLEGNAGRSVYLPEGVAHGFCVTSEVAVLSYLLSSPFNADYELEIDPFDVELNVPWTITGEPIVSDKDRAAPSLDARRVAQQLPLYRP